ncbi:ABC transporter substrate-binding protein [Roseomonas sp. CAU 1739]|uniref:ABC transporter substrate-binding protein n=1 Tax=Roseomonas sp. CAU 1739 TaxID=3140364 RepID=UPI00325A5821
MRPLRFLLNGGPSGPLAGFFLAEAEGFFAREGIAPVFLAGGGAAASIEDMDDATCDLAYGDMPALVARLGGAPEGTGPAAIFIGFNRTPLTIAVAADGPIRRPADLAGRRISGHGRDAALRALPALALRAGIDPAAVTIIADPASLADQARRMLDEDAADGVFGFANTIIASLEAAGLYALVPRLHFLDYAEVLPELHGNALVASRALLDDDPALLRGALRAVCAGMAAAIAEPARAVVSLCASRPKLIPAVELRRLQGTIAREMAHPDRFALGLGDADPARIAAGVDTIADALRLPRRPQPGEVFTAAYLPARPARPWPVPGPG